MESNINEYETVKERFMNQVMRTKNIINFFMSLRIMKMISYLVDLDIIWSSCMLVTSLKTKN